MHDASLYSYRDYTGCFYGKSTILHMNENRVPNAGKIMILSWFRISSVVSLVPLDLSFQIGKKKQSMDWKFLLINVYIVITTKICENSNKENNTRPLKALSMVFFETHHWFRWIRCIIIINHGISVYLSLQSTIFASDNLCWIQAVNVNAPNARTWLSWKSAGEKNTYDK